MKEPLELVLLNAEDDLSNVGIRSVRQGGCMIRVSSFLLQIGLPYRTSLRPQLLQSAKIVFSFFETTFNNKMTSVFKIFWLKLAQEPASWILNHAHGFETF